MNYIQTPVSLLLDKSLSPTDRIVLQYLLWRQGNNQNCWPAIRTIAAEVGIGINTVRRSTDKLARTSRLTIHKPDSLGRGHKNNYIVQINVSKTDTITARNVSKTDTISRNKCIQNGRTNVSKMDTELTPVTNTNKTLRSNSNDFRLAELLLNLILERKSDFRKPNLQMWAVHVERMIRLDKRTPERIEAIIHWSQRDSFWQGNILSTAKLREQFDQLELKMRKQTPALTTAPPVRDKHGKTEREKMIERTKAII